jgi:pentatricopeptide repeat protein
VPAPSRAQLPAGEFRRTPHINEPELGVPEALEDLLCADAAQPMRVPRFETGRLWFHDAVLERPVLGPPLLDPAVEQRHPFMPVIGYALLMDALAAQGNVAEAMRVYDRARSTLDQELGIIPGRAIQDAHSRLLGMVGHD